MPDFATVTLAEIEDAVGERAPGIEVRCARKHLDSRELGVSHFRYAPNLRGPFGHSHREQEEVYVVVAGSARSATGCQQWRAPVRVPSQLRRSTSIAMPIPPATHIDSIP